MTKTILKLWLVVSSLVLVLIGAPQALAWEVKQGGDITLSAKETLVGSQLVFGNNLKIDTKIDGDLICAGQSVLINSEVTGDVLCAGQSLTINGKVGGNVRAAGQILTINGSVAKNVNLFGQTITLSDKSIVRGELFTAGSEVTANGKVVKSWVATSENLTIGTTAVVSERLKYTSKNEATIATGSRLLKGHERTVTQPESVTDKANRGFWRMRAATAQGLFWGSKVAELMMGVLFGLIIVFLFPKWLEKTVGIATKKMGQSLLWGVILLAVAPVLLVMMVITIIGIPLAMASGALLLVWCGLAHVTASTMIGGKLMAKQTLMWRWLIGYIGLWIVSLIPIVGWLTVFLAVLTGIGAVKISILHKQK